MNENVLLAIVATVGAGILIGFWTWVRSQLNKQTAQIAVLQTQIREIHFRCADRKKWIEKIDDRMRRVDKNVAVLGAKLGAEVESPNDD